MSLQPVAPTLEDAWSIEQRAGFAKWNLAGRNRRLVLIHLKPPLLLCAGFIKCQLTLGRLTRSFGKRGTGGLGLPDGFPGQSHQCRTQ